MQTARRRSWTDHRMAWEKNVSAKGKKPQGFPFPRSFPDLLFSGYNGSHHNAQGTWGSLNCFGISSYCNSLQPVPFPKWTSRYNFFGSKQHPTATLVFLVSQQHWRAAKPNWSANLGQIVPKRFAKLFIKQSGPHISAAEWPDGKHALETTVQQHLIPCLRTVDCEKAKPFMSWNPTKWLRSHNALIHNSRFQHNTKNGLQSLDETK